MTKIPRRGSEDARNEFPSLIDAAERGRATIITRRGRAVAALVSLEAYAGTHRQQSLLALAGSGRNLWGPDSRTTLAGLRDEWSR